MDYLQRDKARSIKKIQDALTKEIQRTISEKLLEIK